MIRWSRLIPMALPLTLLSGLAGPATVDAALIYSYLDGSTNTSGLLAGSFAAAASFKTTADSVITSITVKLFTHSSASGNLSFYIFDAAGVDARPGALIETLGSIDVSGLTTTASNYSLTGLDVALTPHTSYWLVGNGPVGDVGWSGNNYPFDTPPANSNGGSTTMGYPNGWNGPMGWFYLRANIEAIPEPPSYALASMGAIMMSYAARRGRKAHRVPALSRPARAGA